MDCIRSTIAAPDHPKYDAFKSTHCKGDTATHFDLVDNTIVLKVIEPKTGTVLAEETFRDSGEGERFVEEMRGWMERAKWERRNVSARGLEGTPEPEAEGEGQGQGQGV